VERGQHDQGQMAVEGLAPAGRLGAVLGWTLLALGGLGLIAYMIAIVQAHVAADAVRHARDAWHNAVSPHVVDRVRATAAYAAFVSAQALAQQANVRVCVLAAATCLSALVIPGVLYAGHPHYLGGPLGGLLRQAATSARRRQPRPWRQIARRQGLGLVFSGAGWAIFWMAPVVAQLIVTPLWWLIAAMLLCIPAQILSFPLIGDGAWWFKPRIASHSQREPEEP
jgi:hypothetical protein